MRKTLALILALVLVLSLSAAAMADGPSVGAKAAPEVAAVKAVDKDGNVVKGVTASDITITPVSEAKEADKETAEQLEEAYDEIKDAKSLTALVPNLRKVVASIDKTIKANDLVVTDLFSVSVSDKAAAAFKDGVRVVLDFETKLKADDVLVILQYIDGKWVALDSKFVVINDDGTVSVSIDTASPIAFLTTGA